MESQMILEAKMLGREFVLKYEGKEIVLDRNAASKTTQLLQILLLYAEKGISKLGLIDALYGREEVENKNGSLNNTIFRLRKQLKAAGLPQSNYVNIRGGMCIWDEAIPTQIDAREFEELVIQGKEEADPEKRAELYLRAVKTYTGEFLPNMIGEDWVAVQNVHLRDLYFFCMEELCKYLTEKERYEEIYEITRAGVDIYPFENLQIYEIDSLIAMERYGDAMKVYEDTSRLIFDELGLAPTPEMVRRYRILGERVSQAAGAIEDIKARLTEKEKLMGAYFCTYPSFVDIYQIFSRMMERNGVSVYIMLCTLKSGDAMISNEKEKDREAAEMLRESIRRSLRRGDFYTRYNHAQFLVMLSEISQENCRIVSERIARDFAKEAKKEYRIDFYVASVAEVLPEGNEAPANFRNSRETWKK